MMERIFKNSKNVPKPLTFVRHTRGKTTEVSAGSEIRQRLTSFYQYNTRILCRIQILNDAKYKEFIIGDVTKQIRECTYYNDFSDDDDDTYSSFFI